nr:unnamed protein product [Digitaria exilis]
MEGRSTSWVLLTAAVVAALLFSASAAAAAAANTTATSNCTRTCGKLDIPFPFGVEPSCYLPGLNVTCRNSSLFLGDGTVQVLEISIPNNTVRINSSVVDQLPGAAAAAAAGALAEDGPYSLPAVLEWSIIDSTCHANASSPACRSRHSHCENTTASGWHLCHCMQSCQCAEGRVGNPFVLPGCIVPPKRASGFTREEALYASTTFLLLALGVPIIIQTVKLHKVKKLKEKYFKRNHGVLLQQLISQNSDIGERMIITLEELEKATNNFDTSHEIGGGGHGVVYKGLLHLQVVAIKKSRMVVQREIDDFINEVAILSQINHRNVVKLLGCCLETEVPLLVYEFISNGTLAQHLHVNGPKSLSWDDRLRIAFEISKALAYLHSAASTPILHRDIKSSNVLLDDSLTTKILRS